MSVKEKIEDVYQHVQNGTALDAFEQYYADNVTMILEDGTEVEGKDANRDRENEFFDSVEEFHGAGVVNITANEEEEATAVESWMDVTFKEGGRMKIEQVATQDWENGKIVRERFYGTQQN
ncbi:nuclear transport factor 2 family protein [Rhodohalobacter barkolensis]|uniref:Nuclear transport factor 2 family protein n=1 Tax=Rhodohalobacter barkolensis TaxID=2053187 RepID=A0A2N0VHL6_9BACT|nr:nuclear transport factor 2 family protein [Rhodohalobacter barkolensis]PKD43654.1 nuclear transport factor 2 family protein [Rhodohalobacter barkolensis]